MTATGLAMQMRLFLSQLAKQHLRRLLEVQRPHTRHSPVRTNCVILGSPPTNRSDVIDPETKSRGAIPS